MTAHLDAVTTLQRVAVHIVARARVQGTGRFSLRTTSGGFGTPDFGDGPRRVRVGGGTLFVESDRPGAASVLTAPLQGSTLASLAELAGVDLSERLDVGHDTPPVGDADTPLELDLAHAAAVHCAHALGAEALDLVAATVPTGATPTLARLWPEHFDVALDAEARPGVRINLGVSPGDGFVDEPYAYAGPWTADRPGADGYWNASFGAARSLRELGNDPLAIAAFLQEGLDRLAR
jgi:hypothetical protein